ncbi:HDOD domain-containing protein [Aestuariibacter halophilus]|uniref:HDOD domain-containing protein n=1 Tax=Fluctibacter halophilus TaxID=226011 RepID=A0ABS8G7I2_9ALTE|nr:HDOD domain-containing protein [Aestuariibacter halophilus]MCC2616483.1 HDOD domain-containing protein [Aestuariibacter halophilus]
MQLTEYAEKASESFVLPDVCLTIRRMLDDDNSAIEDIATVVSTDPSLTSKLLKLANSPLFRFRSQVDSITKAVNVIGGEALYNLVMAETASSAFSHFSNDDVDLQRFWKLSMYAGLIAKHLAKQSRVRGSERFFLLGLLHNLGELVVAKHQPEAAKACAEYSKQVSPWQKQQQVLGFTYAQCSAEILKAWQLPVQLHYAVENLHNESKALTNKEIAILFTAIRAAAAVVSDGMYQVQDLVNPLVLNSAGLDDESLDDAIHFTTLEANKMLAIMAPSS